MSEPITPEQINSYSVRLAQQLSILFIFNANRALHHSFFLFQKDVIDLDRFDDWENHVFAFFVENRT